MDLISFKNDKNILDIIAAVGWTTFCGKPDEGALNMVKEFYANLEQIKDDKVFVHGHWVVVSGEIINTLL